MVFSLLAFNIFFQCRDLSLADKILLIILSEYAGVKYLYTPLIRVNIDFEAGKVGYFRKFLKPIEFDFPRKHFYFHQEYIDNGLFLFDEKAAELADKFAMEYIFAVMVSCKFVHNSPQL